MTATRTTPHVPPQRVRVPRQPVVAVVGLGYVGLPTAISLTSATGQVVGVEISAQRVQQILDGESDHAPDQQVRLDLALASHQLRMTDDATCLADADAVVICVPTPIDKHFVPDLVMLRRACTTVVNNARPGQTIVLTSTTYAGCTQDLLVRPLADRGLIVGEDVFVAFSPERINPGSATHTPETTPRVIGGVTPECARRASDVLRATCSGFHVVSSPAAAEMTKLLENTYRAVNIAMVNEFADAANALGLAPTEIIEAAASKPYGFMRFDPGPGVGGHCIPCDPHYLLWQLRARRVASPVIESSMANIARRPLQVVARIGAVLADQGLSLRGARVHLWGVAYKPGVADARESPALAIMEELASLGARLTYSDPRIGELEVNGLRIRSSPDRVAHADLVVAVTIHPEDDVAVLSGRRVLDTTFSLRQTDGVVGL